MKYRNASHVLPDELLKEVQKYVAGEAIYIPNNEEKRKCGEGSGARQFYQERNKKIQADYQAGMKVEELMDKYGLSVESIKRIIYIRRNNLLYYRCIDKPVPPSYNEARFLRER